MIDAILIDSQQQAVEQLIGKLEQDYPDLHICGIYTSLEAARSQLDNRQPRLIFIDARLYHSQTLIQNHQKTDSCQEIIFMADVPDYALEAIKYQISGYLVKPINDKDLSIAVRTALYRLWKKQKNNEQEQLLQRLLNQNSNELIGIPTIEGFEFIAVSDILRCEGLHKCTRVVTKERSDLISSYNIGEFGKLLIKFGFFAPHKSHLINMNEILRYHKEGTIIMSDNSTVPVSRRRKALFLNQLEHLLR